MAIPKTTPSLRPSLSNPSLTFPVELLYPAPMRRATEFDISRPPPRYSTLIGALPPPTSSNSTTTYDNGVISPSFQLPAYSNPFLERSQSVEATTPRPSTASSSHTQHNQTLFPISHSRNGIHKHESYIINGNKAKPWATLKVFSRSSSNLDGPHFTEGEIIRGVFELNLDTPQNINSICLSLRGRITTSSYENGGYTFLDHPITSWDRNDGDPRSMFFMPQTTTKKCKLSGQYSWPFSLAFPEEVTIRGQHQYLSKSYPTPRSFLENDTNTSLRYELILRITHGRLRADSKLNVEIVYVPNIIPDPFSLLCQTAYRENATTPGPDEDPEGWLTLSHANIHGKLSSNDRHAHLRCTLSLAKPQCYPRGSMIPCHLSIRSTNTEALDTLANHKFVRICLVRRIHFHEDPKQAYSRTQQSPNAKSDQVPAGIVEQVETIERAVWWATSSEEPDTRCLEGEIHLDKELQPSSQFLLFKVSYTIELYPFEPSVFKCTNSGFANTDSVMRKPKAFLSHPVTIATRHRQGQVPVPATILKKPHSRKRVEFPPPEFSFCAV